MLCLRVVKQDMYKQDNDSFFDYLKKQLFYIFIIRFLGYLIRAIIAAHKTGRTYLNSLIAHLKLDYCCFFTKPYSKMTHAISFFDFIRSFNNPVSKERLKKVLEYDKTVKNFETGGFITVNKLGEVKFYNYDSEFMSLYKKFKKCNSDEEFLTFFEQNKHELNLLLFNELSNMQLLSSSIRNLVMFNLEEAGDNLDKMLQRVINYLSDSKDEISLILDILKNSQKEGTLKYVVTIYRHLILESFKGSYLIEYNYYKFFEDVSFGETIVGMYHVHPYQCGPSDADKLYSGYTRNILFEPVEGGVMIWDLDNLDVETQDDYIINYVMQF